MTQQPIYPPQYPGQPQQPPAQQFVQQGPPTWAAPPQQFAPQYVPQQQPPAQPLATGTLDEYYSQPSSGGGPSIGWSTNGVPKPDGTSYAGVVARDVTNADIQQQTDPKTNAPKFYRDGRPMFVMKVPLKVQPSQEFPEGEAVLFVRGQMRDELVRAMTEAGCPTGSSPKAGDVLQVTLTNRKPSRGGGNPQNIFAIRYQPAQTPVQGPAAGLPPEQPAVPVQQPAPQYQSPVATVAPSPAPVVQAPVPQPVAQQPAPPVEQPQVQQQQQQAPVQVQQTAPLPPSDLSPEQQQLLAQLTAPRA